MPPIPQQQTSRGGLITALVISILFAVGFLIWAIMNNAENTKLTQTVESQKATINKVIGAGSVGNIQDLQAQFSGDTTRTGTLVDAAVEQRKAMGQMINGDPEGNEKNVRATVKATMDAIAANAALKGTSIPPTQPLTGVIETLTKKVQDDAAAVEKAKADVAAAQKALQDATNGYQAAVAQKDQAVAAAQAAQQKSETDAKAAIDEKQKQVDDFSKQVADIQKQLTDTSAQ